MRRGFVLAGVLVLHIAGAAVAPAQDDTTGFRLGALQDSAEAHTPRARQIELLARQLELRRRTLGVERLPVIAIEGQTQYQSDVARVPVPGAPSPPHDTYDARLGLTQRLLDPSLPARRELERAQTAQAQAALRSSLYALRSQVNDAFFGVLRAQVQTDELNAAIASIEAQMRVAAARVREGVALRSEELTLRAELLRRRQLLADAGSQRRAAIDVLAALTGVALDSGARLAVPEFPAVMSPVRAAMTGSARFRPEFAQFAQSREVLRRQERVRAAQDLPRASAFARTGYGQPGLNPLNDGFDTYWLAGVQVQWAPWTWGSGRRDREVLAVQRDIIATDEAAFADQLHRAALQDLAAVDRIEAAARLDDEIIAARAQIADETRVRYGEAAVTAAELVERQTELLSARLTGALHRVELAHARARLLTTLGIEVP